MKQHLFGFVGLSLAVALAAGCKSNPQSSLDAVPAAIQLTASHIVVNVADSVRVDAQVVDAQGTPLTTLPDASSNDPGVVSLSTIDPYPVPETSFWVKGETFGAGSISVTSGSLSATITVQTYPKAARVGNPPADTIMSGTPVAPYPIALDAATPADSIAAPADSFYYTTSDAGRLSVDSATGAGLAKLDGAATITLHVAGGGTGVAPTIVIPDTTVAVTATPSSAVNLQHVTLTIPTGQPAVDGNTAVYFSALKSFGAAGRAKATVVSSTASSLVVSVPGTLPTDSTYDVVIEGLGADDYTVMTRVTVIPPPAFTGTFDDNTPNTAQIVTATKGASGPLFDADTKVSVGGIPAFIQSVATDGSTITFVIPYQFSAGDAAAVTFLQLDVDQQARTGSVVINAVGTDPSGPADTLPATAPVITADGNYYVLLTSSDPDYGTITGDGGEGNSNFFTVTAGATDLKLDLVMDWDAPGASTGDMDLFTCTGTCTAAGDFSTVSASADKPEKGSITVPAGTTVHILMLRWAAGVAAGDLVQLHVTGF